MSNSQYPRELHHPNGYRTVTVFDAEEHRRVENEFAAFRRGDITPADEEKSKRRGRPPRGLVGTPPEGDESFEEHNNV